MPTSPRNSTLSSCTDLVLELIEGGDLLEYILRQGGLSKWVHVYRFCQLLTSF